jgi:Lipocalin-like domain
MRAVVVILLAISRSLFAAEADRLIGVWRLVSFQVIVENGPPQNDFGAHPKGFLLLTREGRSIVVTTAEHRVGGMSDSERPPFHKDLPRLRCSRRGPASSIPNDSALRHHQEDFDVAV